MRVRVYAKLEEEEVRRRRGFYAASGFWSEGRGERSWHWCARSRLVRSFTCSLFVVRRGRCRCEGGCRRAEFVDLHTRVSTDRPSPPYSPSQSEHTRRVHDGKFTKEEMGFKITASLALALRDFHDDDDARSSNPKLKTEVASGHFQWASISNRVVRKSCEPSGELSLELECE